MVTKAGVWIDHKHAIVVLVSPEGHEVSKFEVGTAEPFPATAESRAQHSYTRNDFVPEARRERKLESESKEMYEQVLKTLHGVERLFILGPGEAKGEFNKLIVAKKIRGLSVEIETADKMTEPQLVAKVTQHFSASLPANAAEA